MNEERINRLSPVTLAYIGDAVFSLHVRTRVVECAEYKPAELSRRVNSCVSAVAQSAMLERVQDLLTEEEKEIVRRGRNCHTPYKAKNASLADYKKATALEALVGWLYLKQEHGRLDEIEDICVAEILGKQTAQ